MLKSFFSLLCLLYFSNSLFSGDVPKKPAWHEQNRIAFLVGVNKYDATSSLKYAENDVEKLEDLFLQVGHFSKIVKLTDKGLVVTTFNPSSGTNSPSPLQSELNPKKETILQIYKSLIEEKPDLLVFYFSGHGFISGDRSGENSIAPSDVRLKPGKPGEAENGISLLGLADLTNDPEYKSTNLVYLIDACRSPLPKSQNKKSTRGEKSLDGNKNADTPSTQNLFTSRDTKSAFVDKDEEISDEIANAGGVVMLLGAAPGGSALEDKDLESGAFSYFLRKAISGGVHNENPEEYVTINSLKQYIEYQFQLYNTEENRSKQELYQFTNNRGFKGDFLLTYGRPPRTQVQVEKPLFFDEIEQRYIKSKLIYNQNKKRSSLKFFAKNNRNGRYYPESLGGVAEIQYEFEPNSENTEDFYASEINLENKKTFEHKMTLIPEKGWEYQGLYQSTTKDQKDPERMRIYFERKIMDFQGNVLLQEYFDRKGAKMSIGKVATLVRAYDSFGQKTLEETFSADGELVAPKTYARYAAIYKSPGNLLSEAWYDAEGELVGNETGIARTEYIYDKIGRLKKIQNFDKNGSPASDSTGISLSIFEYDPNCLKFKREKLELTNIEFLVNARNNWKFHGYQVCTSSVVYLGKKGEPAHNSLKISRKKYTFSADGNKIAEEFFRTDDRRWTKNGIAKIEHKYDTEGNIIKTSFFGEYEVDGKPVPASDEFGVHSYLYTYDFNHKDCLKTRKKQGAEYKDYDCADTIVHLGIDGKPISNIDDIEQIRIWYTGANQKEELREYYGKDNTYIRSNQLGYISIFDSGLNKTLYAYYAQKEGRELLVFKIITEYNDSSRSASLNAIHSNKLLEAAYSYKDGKEVLDYMEIYHYDEKGRQILTAKYILKDKKAVPIMKIVSEYSENPIHQNKNNPSDFKTLEAKFNYIEGQEIMEYKNIFEFDEMGNNTLIARFINQDGQETLDFKEIYNYNTHGNQTLKIKYINKEGKEEPIYKVMYEYKRVKSEKKLYQSKLPAGEYKSLEAKFNIKDGKDELISKVFFDYNQFGKVTSVANFTMVNGKETLEQKKIYIYNDLGQQTAFEKYILKEDKETLAYKHLYEYNEKGNVTLEAYYENIDGKEQLLFKQIYGFNNRGNLTLEAKYTVRDNQEVMVYKNITEFDDNGKLNLEAKYLLIDGKETLVSKTVFESIDSLSGNNQGPIKYTGNGNQKIEAKYTFKDGKESLIYKNIVFDDEAKEVEAIYLSKLSKIIKEIDPEIELPETESIIELRKNKAEETAKRLTDENQKKDYLRKIDDASKEYEFKKKKYTLTEEELNEDGSYKSQKYKLLFQNPRGSFEKRLIRVDMDRFYRPISVVFEER